MTRRPKSDGLRVTKVGLWYFLFLLIVLLAATNTGNNGLFLALAVMGSALVVSHLLAAINVRALEIRLRPPAEIFANSPGQLEIEIANRSRWLPRWLLILTIDPADVEPPIERRGLRTAPLFLPYLKRRQEERDRVELLMRRRGRHRIAGARITSLSLSFPFRFFPQGSTLCDRRRVPSRDLLAFGGAPRPYRQGNRRVDPAGGLGP